MNEEKEIKEEANEKPEKPERIKDKKAKGVIRRKKQKSEKPIATALHLLVESGKVEFGSRKGFRNAASGKVKALIIARNAPKNIRERISKYCKTNNTPLIEFDGSSLELGAACGKPYLVSVVSIFDAGSSNIMKLAKNKK